MALADARIEMAQGERILEFLPADAAESANVTNPRSQVGEATLEITLLDSFDRRLWQAGRYCAFEQERNGRARLVFGEAEAVRLGLPWVQPEPPRFAWEVEDPELRGELHALLEVRALLPQCKLRCTRQVIAGGGEPIPEGLCLTHERYSVLTEQGRRRPLGTRLLACWQRGDDKRASRALANLRERGMLAPAPMAIWNEALAAAGKLPSSPGADANLELMPQMRADAAVRRVLASLFDVMRHNEAGVIDNLDSEFLHDFRVAIRRSRAVLGQLRGVFPARSIARHEADLAWLGAVTGPTRDLDVYLLHFAELSEQLPPAYREDLGPLRELLVRESEAARTALVRALQSARYRRFKEGWTAFLERPSPRRPASAHALEPIAALAGRRVWKLYRRVAEAAGTLDASTPADQVHRLRKTCKKLRYLLEYMQPFHPADRIRRPIKDLKQLQDHLGAFQDAEVQRDYLSTWFAELRADPQVSSGALLALGMLFGVSERLQAERRAAIPKALRQFARKEERHRFRSLFKQPAVDGETPPAPAAPPESIPKTGEKP